jgi:hypothetical protein
MTTKQKRIAAGIGIAIVILILCISIASIINATKPTPTATTQTKNDNVYSVDLQTVVEIHFKHVEKGGKLISDTVPVYEAKTEGIIIYQVQTSDGVIVDRVAFVLDDLWAALR